MATEGRVNNTLLVLVVQKQNCHYFAASVCVCVCVMLAGYSIDTTFGLQTTRCINVSDVLRAKQ